MLSACPVSVSKYWKTDGISQRTYQGVGILVEKGERNEQTSNAIFDPSTFPIFFLSLSG
jgi:hypothetical protein